jgi:hypothetical protein
MNLSTLRNWLLPLLRIGQVKLNADYAGKLESLMAGELSIGSVISKMETTASEGKNYETTFYRLEAILAEGYRVNSTQATDFRKWATQTLNEFISKGFVMDDERLKQGKSFGQDYF